MSCTIVLYIYSCFAGRISNVTTAQINSVFLVKTSRNFTCDIPFTLSDINE